jgi:hypothetical protein
MANIGCRGVPLPSLYLDGEFAAFVADDRPLPGCYKLESGERG